MHQVADITTGPVGEVLRYENYAGLHSTVPEARLVRLAPGRQSAHPKRVQNAWTLLSRMIAGPVLRLGYVRRPGLRRLMAPCCGQPVRGSGDPCQLRPDHKGLHASKAVRPCDWWLRLHRADAAGSTRLRLRRRCGRTADCPPHPEGARHAWKQASTGSRHRSTARTRQRLSAHLDDRHGDDNPHLRHDQRDRDQRPSCTTRFVGRRARSERLGHRARKESAAGLARPALLARTAWMAQPSSSIGPAATTSTYPCLTAEQRARPARRTAVSGAQNEPGD